MPVTAGIDIGAGTTKAVLMDERQEVLVRVSLRTGPYLERAAASALEEVLQEAGLDREDIAYVATTGYGRYSYPMRDIQITEITCHARGSRVLFPGTRCVLDIGAQSSRAMRVDEEGRVLKFKMNDRCAAGAGRFLERIAKALEMDLKELAEASLRSTDPQPISSICAVLAESEVINHITQGRKAEDIVMGAHLSIAERVLALLRQVGVEEEVTLTGGLSLNPGMVRALEEKLGKRVNFSQDSQYAGAIGAAYLGHWRLKRRGARS
ncbi:MAG: acyl-CoA dehydratase activase [Thermoplasmata archaeon]